jgi:hypothetical protein
MFMRFPRSDIEEGTDLRVVRDQEDG